MVAMASGARLSGWTVLQERQSKRWWWPAPHCHGSGWSGQSWRRSATDQREGGCGDRAPYCRHGPDQDRHGSQRWGQPSHHCPDRHPGARDLEGGVGAARRAVGHRLSITMIVHGPAHHRGSSTPDRLGSSPLRPAAQPGHHAAAGRAHWRRIGGASRGCQTGLGRCIRPPIALP